MFYMGFFFLRSALCCRVWLLPHNAVLGKQDSGFLQRRQSAGEAAEAKQFNEAFKKTVRPRNKTDAEMTAENTH